MLSRALIVGAFMALAGALATPATAQDGKASIMLHKPWARASMANRPAAAYLMIDNRGDQADRLVAAATPAAGRVELHTHIMEGDVMKMRQVEAIEVPAGDSVALEPGGLHIMLFDLDPPLKEGDSFPLTLTFEKAGALTATVAVQAMGAMGMDHGHDKGKMKHSH
ncbi:MAG: copper chaperone PCu(A)C [Kiloniellales bacterium]|nr:copper chaperone PCu(A)C [Kiloniellales bacterium]